MTLEQIRASDQDFLLAKDICDLLHCKQESINVQAQMDPTKLGFPVCVMGSRVRIPRLAFLHWMLYGASPVVRDRA